MITPYSFYGYNFAAAYSFYYIVYDIFGLYFFTIVIKERECRSALMASYSLCVVSSVFWIFILTPALLTHDKLIHGCVFSIIRKIFYDTKSRAAICTCDKRILKSSVGFIKQFTLALTAHCNI